MGGKQSVEAKSEIGLVGLAVMGQNLALNIAEKGFKISVHNRSYEKTEACVKRAEKEGLGDNLTGYKEMKDFVLSLQKPRRVIILVQVGSPPPPHSRAEPRSASHGPSGRHIYGQIVMAPGVDPLRRLCVLSTFRLRSNGGRCAGPHSAILSPFLAPLPSSRGLLQTGHKGGL